MRSLAGNSEYSAIMSDGTIVYKGSKIGTWKREGKGKYIAQIDHSTDFKGYRGLGRETLSKKVSGYNHKSLLESVQQALENFHNYGQK